jgi:predicted nucleotidyltransferase
VEGQAMTMNFSFDTGKLIEICRQNDIKKVGAFGSMARGEATEQSDIDLLVEFAKPKSLLAMVKLERQIATALGRKVDLLTEAAISPYLREGILRDLQVIYEI